MSPRHTPLILLALVVAALPLLAQTAPTAEKGAPQLTKYQIDPVHSELTFRLRHLLGRVAGTFGEWSGVVAIDETTPRLKRGLLTMAIVVATSGCGETNGAGPATPAAQTQDQQQVSAMKIRMTIEGTPITATLEDNATSRDFVSLLPLTLTLRDYASTEKIADLSRRLSTDGAPPAMDPHAGDITYYARWGNLALFYKDGHLSKDLVKLGTIDGGLEALRRCGPFEVTIDREVQPRK